MKLWIVLVLLLLGASPAMAQLQRVPTCGTGQPPPGTSSGTQDTTGNACVTSAPGTRTIIPLDVSTVTTGGTAVTALNAGHATAGGYLITANSAGICVDQSTTAGDVTGTPSTTACVAANVPFYLAPTNNAVSVNSTASSVSFAGEGLQ